jgi:hypothetical protein
MRYLKRYSAQYQTLEVEMEVKDTDEARVISPKMDEFAKEELNKMIKIKEDLEPKMVGNPVKVDKPNYSKNTYGSNNTSKSYGSGPSTKQLKILVDNLDKTKSYGTELGLNVNNQEDCKNLTKKDAGKVIDRIFNG